MLNNLFLSVFEISISTSLIILILLMFSPVLNKRYAAKWKYCIWIFIALRLVIPVNIHLPLGKAAFNLPVNIHLSPGKATINLPENIMHPAAIKTGTDIPIILQMEEKITEITLLDFLSVIWVTVCLCFLFVHIFSFLHYRAKIIKKGTTVENPFTLQLLFELQKDLRIKANTAIIKYPGAASPMMIGFFRHILVLPDEEYSQEELFFILKHELIHLKRKDTCFKLLFTAANSIHWFNPLVYIMRKEAAIDMELSCDERVIQGTDYAVRKAYTETLLSTLHKQYKKATALTTQFYGGNTIMKKRFKNILLKSKRKNGLPVLVGVLGATLALGMITGFSLPKQNSNAQADNNLLYGGLQDSIFPESKYAKYADNANTGTAPEQPKEPEKTVQDNWESSTNVLSDDAQDSTKSFTNVLSDDARKLKKITKNFTAAYFGGDIDTVRSYLADSYEWDAVVYTEKGKISKLTIKGLTDVGEETVGSKQTISVEYKDSNVDSLRYLTLGFIKQKDGWKIQYYGLEG